MANWSTRLRCRRLIRAQGDRQSLQKSLNRSGTIFGVPDRMLDVPVAEVVLQSPCVVAIIGELKPSQGGCSRSSTKVMVSGWPAKMFPSAFVNGKEAHRLSVCATAMRYDERSVSDGRGFRCRADADHGTRAGPV